MFTDTIEASNKIINSRDLVDILDLLSDRLTKYKQIYEVEKNNNVKNYSFKDNGSKMTITAYFSDGNSMVYNTYDSFRHSFFNRIKEIIKIDVDFCLDYFSNNTRFEQTIKLNIAEDSFKALFNLNNEDKKLEDVYNYVKNKLLYAQDKNDDVVIYKGKIKRTIILSTGLIPSMIIVLLPLIIPYTRKIILKGMVVYPVIVIVLAFIIGLIFKIGKLKKYYSTIKKKESCEVLIGRKTNSLDNRKEILLEYQKYQKRLPLELIVLLTINIVIIFIGYFVLI